MFRSPMKTRDSVCLSPLVLPLLPLLCNRYKPYLISLLVLYHTHTSFFYPNPPSPVGCISSPNFKVIFSNSSLQPSLSNLSLLLLQKLLKFSVMFSIVENNSHTVKQFKLHSQGCTMIHHYLIPEHFHHSKKKTPMSIIYLLPHPLPLASGNHQSTFCLYGFDYSQSYEITEICDLLCLASFT